MISPLAYTPFIDPLPLQNVWFLLLFPLALGIAFAYKAVRIGDLSKFPRHVAMFTLQIIIGIASLGLLFLVVIEYLLPIIAPMP